jgi:hydroxymethylpyrimidine/phosphomethylpyrimidine kinase
MQPSPTPPVALTIAGSDSGAGAGIQADLKTFEALGVYGTCAIAALTAQNTRGVRAAQAVEPALLRAQIACVLEDLPVAAAKTGMLANAELVRAVAEELGKRPALPLVVDPVLVAKSGDRLLERQALEALRERLVPRASVLTPNLPEAAELLWTSERAVLTDPEGACRALLALGPACVVLKGGHAHGSFCEDLFARLDEHGQLALERLMGRRVDTRNTHGTGCTFSAALCAALARGASPLEAARSAKRFVQRAIELSREWKLGAGHGPLDQRGAALRDG